MISFLDIRPKPATETVTIETMSGPAEFELNGIMHETLADLAGRYPAFAKIIEGGAGSLTDAAEALPALIAAALGHPGEQAYEDKARTLPAGVTLTMAATVMRLTFQTSVAGPLSPTPAATPRLVDGADAVPMRQTLLRP